MESGGNWLTRFASKMAKKVYSPHTLVAINEVTLHRAQLVLGWVTVCGQVNHLGM